MSLRLHHTLRSWPILLLRWAESCPLPVPRRRAAFSIAVAGIRWIVNCATPLLPSVGRMRSWAIIYIFLYIYINKLLDLLWSLERASRSFKQAGLVCKETSAAHVFWHWWFVASVSRRLQVKSVQRSEIGSETLDSETKCQCKNC